MQLFWPALALAQGRMQLSSPGGKVWPMWLYCSNAPQTKEGALPNSSSSAKPVPLVDPNPSQTLISVNSPRNTYDVAVQAYGNKQVAVTLVYAVKPTNLASYAWSDSSTPNSVPEYSLSPWHSATYKFAKSTAAYLNRDTTVQVVGTDSMGNQISSNPLFVHFHYPVEGWVLKSKRVGWKSFLHTPGDLSPASCPGGTNWTYTASHWAGDLKSLQVAGRVVSRAATGLAVLSPGWGSGIAITGGATKRIADELKKSIAPSTSLPFSTVWADDTTKLNWPVPGTGIFIPRYDPTRVTSTTYQQQWTATNLKVYNVYTEFTYYVDNYGANGFSGKSTVALWRFYTTYYTAKFTENAGAVGM